MHACHSSVPKTAPPHPSPQDEGLPRSSDERHRASPSIMKTIPRLLFSDRSLPNPLIIPVHQVDDSPGDNQWLLPCTPTLTHLPKLTSNKYACTKDGLATKGAPSIDPPLTNCSICNSDTLIKSATSGVFFFLLYSEVLGSECLFPDL